MAATSRSACVAKGILQSRLASTRSIGSGRGPSIGHPARAFSEGAALLIRSRDPGGGGYPIRKVRSGRDRGCSGPARERMLRLAQRDDLAGETPVNRGRRRRKFRPETLRQKNGRLGRRSSWQAWLAGSGERWRRLHPPKGSGAPCARSLRSTDRGAAGIAEVPAALFRCGRPPPEPPHGQTYSAVRSAR